MTKQLITRFIPYSIAVGLTIFSIIETLTKPSTINENGEVVSYVVNDEIIYGAFGLIIVTIFLFQGKDYWKHTFALLLIFSMTPWIQFYPTRYQIGIGIIHLDKIATGLLILHLLLNRKVIDDTMKFILSK